MALSKKIMAELRDQANQILYFEAAMANETQAQKLITERLVEIYQAGMKAGV